MILTNLILVFNNNHNKNLKHISKLYNNLRMLEYEDPILIGFNNYKVNTEEKEITFNAYVIDPKNELEGTNKDNDTVSCPVNIIYKNAEPVNKVAICNQPTQNKKLVILYCKISNTNTSEITQIKYDEDFKLNEKEKKMELSTLAKKDIISNRESRLSSGDIEVIENARIDKKSSTSFVIKGDNIIKNNADFLSSFENHKIKLVTINYGERKDITCQGDNKKDENGEYNYFLSCKSSEALNTNLKNAYGYFVDEEDKSILIDFADNNSTTIDTVYHQEKKSKNGLSTGGIIAIIIPSIIALLGVLGLTLALRSKSPIASLKDSNNTVGAIGQSSETVVHQ